VKRRHFFSLTPTPPRSFFRKSDLNRNDCLFERMYFIIVLLIKIYSEDRLYQMRDMIQVWSRSLINVQFWPCNLILVKFQLGSLFVWATLNEKPMWSQNFNYDANQSSSFLPDRCFGKLRKVFFSKLIKSFFSIFGKLQKIVTRRKICLFLY